MSSCSRGLMCEMLCLVILSTHITSCFYTQETSWISTSSCIYSVGSVYIIYTFYPELHKLLCKIKSCIVLMTSPHVTQQSSPLPPIHTCLVFGGLILVGFTCHPIKSSPFTENVTDESSLVTFVTVFPDRWVSPYVTIKGQIPSPPMY